MPNIIRTANGAMIDMEALRLKNEHEIAIGNMKVNARGDQINQKKEVEVTRSQRLKDHYQLHTMVPTSESYTPEDAVKPTPTRHEDAPKPEPFQDDTKKITTEITKE